MKYLIFILILVSCKAKDLPPCYTVSIEKVTVYYESSGQKFWDTAGQPVVEHSDTLVCSGKYQIFDVEDLVNGLVFDQEKSIYKCVTIRLVSKKQKNK